MTVLIGADHPWFCYLKPLLDGGPIVRLDFATLAGRSIPWEALFEGTCNCREAQRAAQTILQAFGGSDAPPHELDPRIQEVLQILRDAATDSPAPDELGRRVGLSGYTLMSGIWKSSTTASKGFGLGSRRIASARAALEALSTS